MITVDLPVGGKRERDTATTSPSRSASHRATSSTSPRRPRWALPMLRKGMPVMENVVGFSAKAVNASAIASSVGRNYDPSLRLGRPEGDPRRLAAQADRQGHRARRGCRARSRRWAATRSWSPTMAGRQLDGAAATLDALPAVVARGRTSRPVMVRRRHAPRRRCRQGARPRRAGGSDRPRHPLRRLRRRRAGRCARSRS